MTRRLSLGILVLKRKEKDVVISVGTIKDNIIDMQQPHRTVITASGETDVNQVSFQLQKGILKNG